MAKQLYIIEYESAHWCGASDNVLVWAENEAEARYNDEANEHMESTYRELYSEEYEDEGYENESAFVILSVEPFNEEHPDWKFYIIPGQEEFYPIVNEP